MIIVLICDVFCIGVFNCGFIISYLAVYDYTILLYWSYLILITIVIGNLFSIFSYSWFLSLSCLS